METAQSVILQTVEDIGKIKDIEQLEDYIKHLSPTLKTNGRLKRLFDKRRLHLEDK